MSYSRRKTLALIGGGAVIAAALPAAGFLATRRPQAALAPWALAGGYDDPRLNTLSFALLAPNPHNRQPWLAELIGADRVRIHRDPARNLPQTDPHDRQLTIGMGCFLELMIMAAEQAGHGVALDLFPEGDAGPVAEARFTPGAGRADPLFAHVRARRSCKAPFAARPVAPDPTLAAHARLITEGPLVAELRALTWDAWMVEAKTPRTYRESVELMRIGKAEIEANPDGISLGGPFLETLHLVGVLTRAAQLDPTSTAYRQGVEMYREMLAATPAYAVIATGGNTRIDQIEAGQRWLRLNLATTAAGLALHPVSQCLQEYPEMAHHYARAHTLLARPGETVQMLGRLGYGPQVTQTPRWRLETRMMHA